MIKPEPDSGVVNHFLATVFPCLEDEGYHLCIQTLPDAICQWFPSVLSAAEYAVDRAREGLDVYFCVGLRRDPPTQGRGRAEDVDALPGLWADLDFGPWHKNKALPPDIESALAIIPDDRPASITIHTGHGAHAYWLFKETWSLEAGQRQIAARTSVGWINALRARALAAGGWTVDAVGDHARILRVAGTLNWKDRENPKIVDWQNETPDISRWESDDFGDWMAAEVAAGPTRTVAGDLVLSIEAEPPAMKLLALRENDPKFHKSWTRQRKDGAFSADQSASAYDLSLATMAASAGWTDQEIADLIISWRREHGENVNKVINRRDYLARTIKKARDRQDTKDSTANKQAAKAALDESIKQASEADNDTERLKYLTNQLGVKVLGFEQNGKQRPEFFFTIELDGAEKRVFAGSSINNFSGIKDRLSHQTKLRWVLPNVLRGRWDDIVLGLSRILVYHDGDVDPDSQVRDWLDNYLIQNRPVDLDSTGNSSDHRDMIKMGHPVEKGGKIHVVASHLVSFLRSSGISRMDRGDVIRELKMAGCVRKTINVVDTTRSYYRLADTIDSGSMASVSSME